MKRIIFLTALIATTSTQGIAQQPRDPSPPVIIVSGSAQLEVTPDEATVRLGVVRQENSAQAAQEQANRAAQAILAEIGKLGIPSERIRTSRLTLSPIYAPARPDLSSNAGRIDPHHRQLRMCDPRVLFCCAFCARAEGVKGIHDRAA